MDCHCQINKDLTSLLPNEIFEQILSYIEFNHLQKFCILVCKRWFHFIRSSATLSGSVSFLLEAIEVNRSYLNKLLKNWPQVKDLGLNVIQFEEAIANLFEEQSQESLNSKTIRFNVNSFLLSFLWPNLSTRHLYRMILSLEAKSSFLNTRSISDVTGNAYQLTHMSARLRYQKKLLVSSAKKFQE